MGAGGHAKMVIEVSRSMGFQPACCLAVGSSEEKVLGIPVLAETREEIRRLVTSGASGFVAIGDNRLRERLSHLVLSEGGSIPLLISRRSYVSPSARLGSGTVVMPSANIGAEVAIGSGGIVNSNATVDHDCTLGDYVHIGPGASLAGNVTVERGAFVGAGATVLPEIRIGEGAILGAGAVAVEDVPPNEVWVGVPARPIQRRIASRLDLRAG